MECGQSLLCKTGKPPYLFPSAKVRRFCYKCIAIVLKGKDDEKTKVLFFHQLAIAAFLNLGVTEPPGLVDFVFRVASLEEEYLTVALEG